MTADELITLSKSVAKKLGIKAFIKPYTDEHGSLGTGEWLHEDNARCFELMVKYKLWIEVGAEARGFSVSRTPVGSWQEFRYKHSDDRALATRIVILKAVEAI